MVRWEGRRRQLTGLHTVQAMLSLQVCTLGNVLNMLMVVQLLLSVLMDMVFQPLPTNFILNILGVRRRKCPS